jgi:hypothetical protein
MKTNKHVNRSVVTGAIAFLLMGLSLQGEALGQAHPATAQGASTASCTVPSSPTNPAEARKAASICLREGFNNEGYRSSHSGGLCAGDARRSARYRSTDRVGAARQR